MSATGHVAWNQHCERDPWSRYRSVSSVIHPFKYHGRSRMCKLAVETVETYLCSVVYRYEPRRGS
jgi:hypothetical protein